MISLPLLPLLLACRDDEAPSYQVGAFTVAFSTPLDDFATSDEATLSIAHEDAPDQNLWASPAGQNFLSASHGEAAVEYGSGSFVIEDAQEDLCSAQSIDAVDERSDGSLRLSGALSDCDLSYTFDLSDLDGSRLRFAVTLGEEAEDQEINRLRLRFASTIDEKIFGVGAQYSRFDLKNEEVPVWVQEQGIGRGLEPLSGVVSTQPGDPSGDWWTTYTGVPFFLTSAPRGFYLENQGYARFDLVEAARIEVEAWDDHLTGGLIYGATPADVTQAWTSYTGRMAALPAWTQQGAIVRAGGGSEAVRAQLAALQEAGVPVAGLWIEDWCGSRETSFGDRLWWNWEPDATLYPDWAELVAELDAAEVSTLIYFNPYIVDASEKQGVTSNVYDDAAARGHLVTTKDRAIYQVEMGGFEAALVDLTDPDAVAWLQELQLAQVALGVDGWMADFGEALPIDAVLSDGSDPWLTHNAWPRLWAELNADTAARAGVDLLTFHRSGDARSPASARAFWLGDQTVTWDAYDGIQTVIPALLSSGVSGYALQHTDAGGYLSVSLIGLTRDEELLQRWTELACFTALLRTHDTNEPEENAQVGDSPEALAHFARMARVYAALAPIRATLMAEAEASGLPLARPLFFGWPEERDAWTEDQSFQLGPLIVAPVVEQGADTRALWLPPGLWVHLWTGETLGESAEGSWVTVEAPLGQPPVFYPQDDPDGESFAAALVSAGVIAGP